MQTNKKNLLPYFAAVFQVIAIAMQLFFVPRFMLKQKPIFDIVIIILIIITSSVPLFRAKKDYFIVAGFGLSAILSIAVLIKHGRGIYYSIKTLLSTDNFNFFRFMRSSEYQMRFTFFTMLTVMFILMAVLSLVYIIYKEETRSIKKIFLIITMIWIVLFFLTLKDFLWNELVLTSFGNLFGKFHIKKLTIFKCIRIMLQILVVLPFLLSTFWIANIKLPKREKKVKPVAAQSNNLAMEQLKLLNSMLESGVISEEEYKIQRDSIIK